MNLHLMSHVFLSFESGAPNSVAHNHINVFCSLQVHEEIPASAEHLLKHKVWRPDTQSTRCSTNCDMGARDIGAGDSSRLRQIVQDVIDPNSQNAENQALNVDQSASQGDETSAGDSRTGTESSAKNTETFGNTDKRDLENSDRNSENDSGSETEEETMETCDVKEKNHAAFAKYKFICRPLGDFMETRLEEDGFRDYLIPEKFFRRFWVMDIVKKSDHNCCCFTKRLV